MDTEKLSSSKAIIEPYSIKLDFFEGPLNLLLHLIQQQEMDITEISISAITDQYLEYIELMELLDLDLASEFIVMAATLLQLKSQSILPTPQPDAGENRQFKDRQELVKHLLEYKRFKEAGQALDRYADQNSLTYTRPEIEGISDWREYEISATLFDLISAFQTVTIRPNFGADDDYYEEIQEDPITVEMQMDFVQRMLTDNEQIRFSELFSEFGSKTEKIATFLAILELVRLQQVMTIQSDHFAEIYLQRKVA